MHKRHVLVMGGIIIDEYYWLDSFPAKGGDCEILKTSKTVGGCSINVSVNLQSLGESAQIVSFTGQDSNAELIREYLRHHNIGTDLIQTSKEQTGYCLVLLDPSGERTFLTQKGCEEEIDKATIAQIDMMQIEYIYVTGYYFLNKKYAQPKITLLNHLRRKGAKIMFDPGALAGKIHPSVLLQLLELAHIAVPNQYEVKLLCRALDIKGSFQSFCIERGCQLVIIKNGSDTLYAYTPEKTFQHQPYNVDVVDTTGAGDSFAAGLLYGLKNKYSLESCLKIASACGALTTTIDRPHGKFSMAEIEEFIAIRGESLCKTEHTVV